MNRRTALYSSHLALNARMVPFGGWDMPVQYSGVVAEHTAVRTAAGAFDISHMARLEVTGPGATELLELAFTNFVHTMKPGQVRYGLFCNDAGGILDDVLVTRWADDDYLVVVNASNRDKILAHLAPMADAKGATIDDQTDATAMVAVQGPRALEVVRGLIPSEVAGMRYYTALKTTFGDAACVVSRTGYTGEDGFELVVPNEQGPPLWDAVLRAGALPCGLGARDTLRLEAAMPLYGHELTESITPMQAGLGWAVKPGKAFVGRDALVLRHLESVRVGLELDGKRAAREGCPIHVDGKPAGGVTSGSYAPWLGKSIAMGYVEPLLSSPGQPVEIDIRGTPTPARVVPLPFYQRR